MSANCKTKEYYAKNYETYIESTLKVDMSEHYKHFLPYLPSNAKILDVGFGSGRDLIHFKDLGYDVLGVDNVQEFVDEAQKIGLNVRLEDFETLEYQEEFNGIWASASLLHTKQLFSVLKNLYNALKTNGVLYLSMKEGRGIKVENGRLYHYVDEQELALLCLKVGFKILESYKAGDLLRRESIWINIILRKE